MFSAPMYAMTACSAHPLRRSAGRRRAQTDSLPCANGAGEGWGGVSPARRACQASQVQSTDKRQAPVHHMQGADDGRADAFPVPLTVTA